MVCLDEPTSMMAESDAEKLFHVMGELTKSGRSFVYVTHRIPEVMRISSRVTVLKNGCVVGRVDPKETGNEGMVQLMTGRAFAEANSVERPRGKAGRRSSRFVMYGHGRSAWARLPCVRSASK